MILILGKYSINNFKTTFSEDAGLKKNKFISNFISLYIFKLTHNISKLHFLK